MSRANSLKKAIRQIIEHTERAVDEQNAQTLQHRGQDGEFPLEAQGAAAPAPPSFLPTLITTGGHYCSLKPPEFAFNPLLLYAKRVHIQAIIGQLMTNYVTFHNSY